MSGWPAFAARTAKAAHDHEGHPAREATTNATNREPLKLSGERLAIIGELFEWERAKLLIEIRHTGHGAFQDELRHRLTLVEDLVDRCRTVCELAYTAFKRACHSIPGSRTG